MVLEPWKHGSWEPAGRGRSQYRDEVRVRVRVRVLTLLHDLHDLQDSVHVFPGCYQTLKHQHLVVVEHVAVWTAHHLTHTHAHPQTQCYQ